MQGTQYVSTTTLIERNIYGSSRIGVDIQPRSQVTNFLANFSNEPIPLPGDVMAIIDPSQPVFLNSDEVISVNIDPTEPSINALIEAHFADIYLTVPATGNPTDYIVNNGAVENLGSGLLRIFAGNFVDITVLSNNMTINTSGYPGSFTSSSLVNLQAPGPIVLAPKLNFKNNYSRSIGTKIYEKSNHLGNVLVTLSDRKFPVDDRTSTDVNGNPVGTADGVMDYYDPNVLSFSDYYPFGSSMPGRSFNSSSYRFGFGGMEMDNEVNSITGSSYTAEFWQYDSRLGRRWNRDPITYSWQSPYATFNNNPIYYADPSGAEGEPVDQKTANSGGGEVGDTYTDINGSVFEKIDIGWTLKNDGSGGVPNPAPLDNTYAYIDKYMGGGKNYDSGKSLLDMLRDLENMMKGGLHIWANGNYTTNFAPKVHDKNIPEFDFNEFQEKTNTYFNAVKRGEALNTTKGKDAYEATKKKVKELEAALKNGNAEEIKAKVVELQEQIHKQDLPPLDYETKVQFFGYPQPDDEGYIYSPDSLYRYRIGMIKGDTNLIQGRKREGERLPGNAEYWVLPKTF